MQRKGQKTMSQLWLIEVVATNLNDQRQFKDHSTCAQASQGPAPWLRQCTAANHRQQCNFFVYNSLLLSSAPNPHSRARIQITCSRRVPNPQETGIYETSYFTCCTGYLGRNTRNGFRPDRESCRVRALRRLLPAGSKQCDEFRRCRWSHRRLCESVHQYRSRDGLRLRTEQQLHHQQRLD